MTEGKQEIPITLEELRTLTSSAIADIHGEVDEIFIEGLRRSGNLKWTAQALRKKRDEIAPYFNRAIELCEELETRAFEPEEGQSAAEVEDA